jgi:hypothetical protein
MPNESLIHADVFFFISTIALVVLSIGSGIALFYVIRILRDAGDVAEKIKAESGEIVADSKRLREALRDEGVKWGHIIGLVRGFFMRQPERRPARKAKAKVESTE